MTMVQFDCILNRAQITSLILKYIIEPILYLNIIKFIVIVTNLILKYHGSKNCNRDMNKKVLVFV